MCPKPCPQPQADNFLSHFNPSLAPESPASGQAAPEPAPESAAGHGPPKTCGSKIRSRGSEKALGKDKVQVPLDLPT